MAALNKSSLVPVAHVYGAAALGTTVAHLRAWGVPVFAQGAYYAGLIPQHIVAVGGVAIAVPKSHVAQAIALLQGTVWETRPCSRLMATLWVFLTLAMVMPPLPTAVFSRDLRVVTVTQRQTPL